MDTKKIRPIKVEGNIAYVPLTQGYEAVIDADDVPLIEGRNWCAHIKRRKDGSIMTAYAICYVNGRKVWMHRILRDIPPGMMCDHVDGNGLNNRRNNLRQATLTQNNRNARVRVDSLSGVKGIAWRERYQAWEARIKVNGKTKHIGTFKSLADAKEATFNARVDLHGSFARHE